MPRPIRTRTDEEWATMIRTQRESDLSIAKFCRQNNIKAILPIPRNGK